MNENSIKTNEKNMNMALDNVTLVLERIQKKVFTDLDRGGNGAGHRVVNEAKHSVEDIINGSPVHIPKKTKIQLVR